MTVASSGLWPRLGAPGTQEEDGPGSFKKKTGKARGPVGLQLALSLVALRVGYKLARSAVGKLFPEPKITPSEGSQQQDDLHGEEVMCADDAAAVAARDQWLACSEPAPDVPDGFKLMASEHLAISVYHFYEQYLSIETTCLQDHHKSTGQYNFRASRWKPEGDGRFSRVFDFMQPKKGMCSTNAHCMQEQRFAVHPGGVFVMTTDMHMENIPYSDCFRVQSFWKAEPDATGMGTNVSIHVAVPFSKRCLVKGIIINTTLNDCKSFFSDFLAKVQNSIATELLPTAAAAAAAAEQLLGASPASSGPPLLLPRLRGAMTSPFATVDAEVFVKPMNSSSSLSQQQQQQHGHPHHRGSSASSRRQQQQQQQQLGGVSEHAGGAAGGLSGGLGSMRTLPGPNAGFGGGGSSRQLSRTVSAKPSFAQPIADLKLVGRVSPAHELLSTAQAILLLLVLLVQLLCLYDNMVLHHKLAAPPATPC